MSGADLRSRVLRYVALRHALGFRARGTERLLLDFAALVETQGQPDAATAQLAVDWACVGSRGSRAQRLSVVRGFLSHVRASLPQIEIPAPGLFRRPRRPAPHIFSDEEISALLREARALGPSGSLRPHTYTTLVGLLASCGLRISEAVGLGLGEAQLDASPPRLLIRESKLSHPGSRYLLTGV